MLALSAYADEQYVRGMMEAGAVGYLLKDEAPGMIMVAVRAHCPETAVLVLTAHNVDAYVIPVEVN